MSTTAEKIAVMQAFELGETVFRKFTGLDGGVVSFSKKYGMEPSWDWAAYEYHVKPKPREVWIGMLPHGGQSDFAWSSKAAAMGQGYTDISLFREVIEP